MLSIKTQVGWLKVDSQTILSLRRRVVIHNSRISVTHDEHRTWNLHIKQVRESDRGCYMCQINTRIMKMKIGCIEVYVPPNIIDEKTSSDTTINEGDNVVLRCNAIGYPTPTVQWQREDKRPLRIASAGRDPIKMDRLQGENLTLTGVVRDQMGAYFCIAKNGVPPIVSKRIQLNVNFAPMVKVDNQLIGSPLGMEVEIQCYVQAFPEAVNYWQNENSDMILTGRKYSLVEEKKNYERTLKLRIKNFTKEDEGQYKCMSTNSLGKSETTIRVYAIAMSSPKSTTEQQNHGQFSTSAPSNGIGTLDHLQQKQYRNKNHPYDSPGPGITSDKDRASSSNQKFPPEKSRYNFEEIPKGEFGISEFDSDSTFSGVASAMKLPRELILIPICLTYLTTLVIIMSLFCIGNN